MYPWDLFVWKFINLIKKKVCKQSISVHQVLLEQGPGDDSQGTMKQIEA